MDGYEAEPGCEVAPPPEALHRQNESLDRHRADQSDTRGYLQLNCLGIAAGLVAQAALDHSYPLAAGLEAIEMQTGQLDDEGRQVAVVDLVDRRLYEGEPCWSHDTVRHQMATQRVCDLIALADQ